MAKLFQVTAILAQSGITRYNPVCTLYLNVENVQDVVSVVYTDNDGDPQTGSQIRYFGYDGTFVETFTVTETTATLTTRMNAANTTDVHKINLNIIDEFAPVDSPVPQFMKRNVAVNVEDIWMLMINPAKNSEALVMLQNPTHSEITKFRTQETAASIAAAANA